MAKIKLGNRPKAFTYTVRCTLPDGQPAAIEMRYRYRTRTEFGALIDELLAEAQVPAPKLDTTEEGQQALQHSLRLAMERTRDTNADYILRIAEGWSLDEPFERDTVAQLCDELPGVALAIIEQYRAAITEGRLGN